MKSKNKNLFLKIYIPFVIITVVILIVLQILGSKKRVGYLTDFNLEIDRTLELNNLNDIKENFTTNGELDEERIKNYLLTNENITNYVYHFRIRYYDKIFRNNDIYGVYPDLSNLPDYMKNAEMEEGGSPYGNFISDRKTIEEEKVDNVSYVLKIKTNILFITIAIIVILLLIFVLLLLYIKFNSFVMKYDLLYVCFLLIAVFIIMFFSLKLNNFKFGLPLKYNYGDTIQFFTQEAMINNEGYYPVKTDRLGAPFGSYFGVFPTSLMNKFDILVNKIISLFTKDPIDTGSIFYFLIFPFTVLSSFFVFRNLKISKFMSIFGSLIFTFIPFVFMRNINHYVLSVIYFIPLSILLCIWLYEDDDLLTPTKNLKDFIRNKKNIMAIIFIILISNNGIAYYPFFTCFLIGITALSKLLKTKNIKIVIPFIISIGLIGALFIINLIPLIIYKKQHLFISNIHRWFFEAEMVGLKISHLILNPKYFMNYYSQAMLVNENRTSYLGIIGVLGFIGLILYIFIKNYHKPLINDYTNRISLLSELNLFAVLLATIGGFASLFNYFITPMIRSYNRISVYIAFICILTFCMFIDSIFKKKNIIFYISFSIILLFTLQDQAQDTGFYDKNEMNLYIQDKKFIENIEEIMPENSSIYQLPTISFNDLIPPVKSKYGNYKHYRHFIGYVFSKDLKWSYGGDYGRAENEWYERVNEMKAIDLLNEISYAGFDGLYIDKGLIGDDELADKIEEELKDILKQQPMIHENGSLLFFDLTNFEANKEYTPIINEYK